MDGEGTQAAMAEAQAFNCEEGEDSRLDEKWKGLDEDGWVLMGRKRRGRSWSKEKREKRGGVRIMQLLEIVRSIYLRRGRIEKNLEQRNPLLHL